MSQQHACTALQQGAAAGSGSCFCQPLACSRVAARRREAAAAGGRAPVGGRHSGDRQIFAWNKLCSCALGPPGRCDLPQELSSRLLARTLGRCRCGA